MMADREWRRVLASQERERARAERDRNEKRTGAPSRFLDLYHPADDTCDDCGAFDSTPLVGVGVICDVCGPDYVAWGTCFPTCPLCTHGNGQVSDGGTGLARCPNTRAAQATHIAPSDYYRGSKADRR